MRLLLLSMLIGLLTSCVSKIGNEVTENNQYQSIEQTFNDINRLLEKDNGDFWNHQLLGPILLVDPDTRIIISNRNNNAKSFQKVGEIYVDSLPAHLNIANTAIDWNGERWTMVMLPLPEENHARNNLIIHELFHRIQPEIDFDSLFEQSNAHLDTRDGRILLRLELQALKKAVQAQNENEMVVHVRNALYARNHRQTSPEIIHSENILELNEGLAEYTGVMLSERRDKEIKEHFSNSVNIFFGNKSFVRSFAYQTVPMYGYLLSKIQRDWHQEITKTTNLTSYFETAFSVDISNILSINSITQEFDYDYNNILVEEDQREKARLEIIAGFKKRFLEQPTLKLKFENMNISFDPRNITPIESFGTVYPTLRITDNWGILEVQNGALLSVDWSNVIVTEPTEIGDKGVKGDGWVLSLSDGWKIKVKGNVYELKEK